VTAAQLQAEFLRGVRFARLTHLISRAMARGNRRDGVLRVEANRLLARLYQAADEELVLLDCE